MTQTAKYVAEVQRILANRENPEQGDQEQSPPDATQPLREIDVYIEEDRITFIPKKPAQEEPQEPIVESTPRQTKPDADTLFASITAFIGLLIIFAMLMLQIYALFHPPIATITLIPQSQRVTLTGTLQFGRVIAPITVTQTQSTATTGKGHQPARSATGYLTVYNGSFSEQTVYAGTVFTGADGIQVVTDGTVTIPAANPPTWGIATVSAHATRTGSIGNIQALDINSAISNDVFVKNLNAFHGGQSERNFQTVTKNDMNGVVATLKTTLSASMRAALQMQLMNGEALIQPACTPTITGDHTVGQEAKILQVTASETCSGIAYSSQELKEKVTDLLTLHAAQTVGTGYSRLGDVQVTIKQAAGASPPRPVYLSFVSQGTWVYALTSQEQQQIKELLAGKSKRNALQLLRSLPGIEKASIAWNEQTTLPNDINAIHLVMLVEA